MHRPCLRYREQGGSTAAALQKRDSSRTPSAKPRTDEICEKVKDERRRMRKEEWQLLNRLYNYDMDYLSRTFIYLKELIEDIMMLADHIKNLSEYIQFLATKYLIFD